MKEDKNISSKAALFQQNTEERLRKSEMRYQNLFDLSPNGLLLEDLNGIILDVNISFCKSLGYKKEELIGKNIQIIIPKEDTDKILPNIKKIISETAMFHTTRNLKKDGNLCWMERKEILVSLPNDDEGILVVSNDITEQMQMEANLRESEYFFKESQRAAFIGSYKVNFQTGIWESSDVLDSIFGIEKFYERTIDSWIDIIYPEDQEMMHKYLLEEVIAKHTSFNKEYRIIRKLDNEIRWVQGKGEIKIDQSDNVVSMIGTIQDITEHKLSEEKLIEIESNATKKHDYFVFSFSVCPSLDKKITKALEAKFNSGKSLWPREIIEKFKRPLPALKSNERYMGSDWTINNNCMTFTFSTIVDTAKLVSEDINSTKLERTQAKVLVWLSFDACFATTPGKIKTQLENAARKYDWILSGKITRPKNEKNNSHACCGSSS